ncbi:MAG TPA: energy transducer TonB [Bryobacteraceae bacterium]|nr:energy transducer TonB [Bryobacteraceae bacterium]
MAAFLANGGLSFAHPQDSPTSAQSSSPTTAPPVSIPSYPDSAKGLEHFVEDMLKFEMEGNQQEVELYEKSLALPDAEGWFRSVFGDDLGESITHVSAPKRADVQVHTGDMLAEQIAAKRTDIEVVRFDDACNDRATSAEFSFLFLRRRPEHLYDVRFRGSSGASLWAYFAYIDGGFRYIGNMKAMEVELYKSPHSEDSTRRIMKGGNVPAPKLIHKEDPDYPLGAKAAGIQGNVVIHAIIAKDGSIRSMELVDGVCDLAQPAMRAVKNWRYSPTTLAGEPIEVDTTITVVFALGAAH